MFEITHLLLATMFVMACVQWLINRSVKKMHEDNEQFQRVTMLAFRDLNWRGIKQTANGYMMDAEQSARDAGLSK